MKVKMTEVSPEYLLGWIKKDSSNVPQTAKALRTAIDPFTSNVILVIEDDSFPDVEDGELPSVLLRRRK